MARELWTWIFRRYWAILNDFIFNLGVNQMESVEEIFWLIEIDRVSSQNIGSYPIDPCYFPSIIISRIDSRSLHPSIKLMEKLIDWKCWRNN
jgi:hypothetical protein